jgi:hypothetical protein
VHARLVTVRFRTSDVPKIDRAASKDGMLRAVWIREAALARAVTKTGAPLPKSTANGEGEPLTVRFAERDYTRIVRAAEREGMLVSSWIRGAALARLNGAA